MKEKLEQSINDYKKTISSVNTKLNLADVIQANNYIGLEQMLKNSNLDLTDKIEADLSYINPNRKLITPLGWAATWGSVECLKIILKNIDKEQIEIIDYANKCAIKNNYTECSEILQSALLGEENEAEAIDC